MTAVQEDKFLMPQTGILVMTLDRQWYTTQCPFQVLSFQKALRPQQKEHLVTTDDGSKESMVAPQTWEWAIHKHTGLTYTVHMYLIVL